MTAIQALRQCIEAMKLVDFKDCAESAELWHKFNLAQANAERVLREGPDAENLFRHAVYSAGMEFAAALCDFSIVHMIKGRDYIDRDSAMALVAKWRYKVDQASKAYRDAAVLREGEKQEPVAWAAESTTGACVRMLTKISLLESEVDRYVNRSDIAAIGCNRVKVPLYRAAPQPPAAPSGDVDLSKLRRFGAGECDPDVREREGGEFVLFDEVVAVITATKE